VTRSFPPAAVLFDLDGTLADTAPDLAYALNRTLAHFGRPALPYEAIRPVVSHGGIALIRLGFGIAPDEPTFEDKRQFLLRVYADNLLRHTALFPGIAECLTYLEVRKIPWGIVTNKPAWLTDPLMAAMALTERAGCIVSGDTCTNRKPHPEPILYACERLDRAASESWYIGDAGRDMEAGRAAGCLTVGALYGYLHPEDPPADWDADLMIETPADVLTLLEAHVTDQR
jgi:phosphoglycolate phosphatase